MVGCIIGGGQEVKSEVLVEGALRQLQTMTTKQAARMAAVGTTLALASALLSNFLGWVHLAVHQDRPLFISLRAFAPTWVTGLVFGAALPVFFFLPYRSQPLLSIPSGLKKVAWAAAIASGFVTIESVLRWGTGLLAWADPVRDAAERMSHPIVWTLLKADHLVVLPLISLFATLALLLFFMAVARSETGAQTAPLGLRRAAMYACVVAALGAAMTLVTVYFTFALSGSSYQKALLQAGPGTLAWWHAILPFAVGVCSQTSRAAFFLTFFLKLPAPQSSQWLSTGE